MKSDNEMFPTRRKSVMYFSACIICSTNVDQRSKSLSEVCSIENSEKSIAEMISQVCQIPINIEDKKTSKVCDNCFQELMNAFVFKIKCMNSLSTKKLPKSSGMSPTPSTSRRANSKSCKSQKIPDAKNPRS